VIVIYHADFTVSMYFVTVCLGNADSMKALRKAESAALPLRGGPGNL
jgi:hypothetical protein